MRHLTVPLGEDDARLLRVLRQRGVSVSKLIRDAIRTEAGRKQVRPRDVAAILAEMDQLYPVSSSAGGSQVDGTDRKRRRRLIRKKLRGRP
jgi:hypothetical protein